MKRDCTRRYAHTHTRPGIQGEQPRPTKRLSKCSGERTFDFATGARTRSERIRSKGMFLTTFHGSSTDRTFRTVSTRCTSHAPRIQCTLPNDTRVIPMPTKVTRCLPSVRRWHCASHGCRLTTVAILFNERGCGDLKRRLRLFSRRTSSLIAAHAEPVDDISAFIESNEVIPSPFLF